MEAVDQKTQVLLVHGLDDAPGMGPGPHVPAPGQGLVADPDATGGRPLGHQGQVLDRGLVLGDRVRGNVAAEEEEAHAQLAHEVELAQGAVEVAGLPLARCPLEVAERLEEGDLEAEVGRELARVAGRAVEVGEVGLEDLDPVEPRCRGGLQLLRQGAAERDGGDRAQHRAVRPFP